MGTKIYCWIASLLLFVACALEDSSSDSLDLDTDPALVAAYAFDEGTGTVTQDGSVHGNTGTLTSAGWSTGGRGGSSIALDGAASFVDIADRDPLSLGTAGTLSAWIYLSAPPSELGSVVNKWSQTADDEYLFAVTSNRMLFFAWHTAGGTTWGTPAFNQLIGTTQVPLATWTHVTVVRDRARISLYVNGALDRSVNAADQHPFRNGTSSLRLGGQGRGRDRFFRGAIDEVRVFRRALSANEVASLYGQTPPITPVSPGIIAADRRVDWSQSGISGGIPNRPICTTLGPTATAQAINAAIAACNNGVVKLAAGTFNLSAGITFAGKSNVTLRGAGPRQTVLRFTGNDACAGRFASVCVRGSSTVWTGNVPAANVRNWTAGYTKGAAQLTISSTAGITPGMILILDQLDDTVDTGGIVVSYAPGFTVEGSAPGRGTRSQQQYVKVTAVSANQVTISPGLHMPNWRASQQPQVWWWGDVAQTAVMNGVEDMTLDHRSSGGKTGIAFGNAYTGWIKNIRSLHANRNHVWLYAAARIEVSNSYFYGTLNAASQSYGVESFMTSDNRVVNNIFERVTAPLMTGPSSGSVMAYNFMIDMYYKIPTWMMAGMVVSHDAGTGMNLFEGNVTNSMVMDLYHGTGALPTLFRNRLTGIEPGKQGNTGVINIWALNRSVNLVGNVLGTAGFHTVYEDSRLPSGMPGNPNRSIYLLGYPGIGETLSSHGVGYDNRAVTSLLRWGNYDYASASTRFSASETPTGNPVPSTHALPASLFLPARPAWWGFMAWPAIGPDVTGGSDPAGHAHDIPAQACYESTPRNTDGTLAFDANSCY
jgi:hypothetical protein